MHPVHEYLKELRDIRLSGGGVRETSYYPILTELLDAAGDDLKPTVRCITTLRNTGAGIPDGGFFTREQFPRAARWRREATRYGREDTEDAGSNPPGGATGPTCDHATDRGPRRRWAQLLARVYEVHPLRCPACHGEMRILAFLTDPGVVRPILRPLRIPEHPPPISPARGPPQTELLAVDPPSPWDQANQRNHATPGRDPFDQSLPGDDGTWSA